ncbi:hypothetical protein P12024L_31 [Nonlabens phage P12024L]|uniref:Uncharacterized protein n=1 Tax=Nonlabens phage P12024L TaxID=1168479 RepID=I6R174_9CAUD|nr:hypothetical protein B618_gp31 [Nonlabens phage P12024L]AFM54751.1 hypothetical protein P12024L_31 [Nonlabens phage P12024L]
MKAKEKAKELYNNYYQHVADGAYPELNAKQCALICVDEILIATRTYSILNNKDRTYHYSKHWQQVKQEINKL